MTSTRQLFTQNNLRCTTQRIALFDTLCACKSHPTAEELFGMVKPAMNSLSLATVYNTLDALCEAGLAKKLPTSKGTCRYDADMSEHLHVRFQDTGEIRDVPMDLSRKLLDHLPKGVLIEIERDLGIHIDGINIQLSGRKANGIS
ncbi:MAG: transcriptional repressor [Planctomycetota bacterium]|nr:transcriptional repressor [Planctomycetota bacterium]